MYQHQKRSHISIFDLATCLKQGLEEEKENTPKRVISCDTVDYEYTSCVWGPLNKTLYISTKEGKLFCKDVNSGKTIKEK